MSPSFLREHKSKFVLFKKKEKLRVKSAFILCKLDTMDLIIIKD